MSKAEIIELEDSSSATLPASFLLEGRTARDPSSLEATFAKQFLLQNRPIFSHFGITAATEFDGRRVWLNLNSGLKVGALPLLSPSSGRFDHGMVIKPRFGWEGIGSLLGSAGFKTTPQILKLPLLPQSERKVPPWVLSSVILARIEALLRTLLRQFEMQESLLSTPRGTIQWARYLNHQLPSGAWHQLPCRFADLEEERELLQAIHFTLKKQVASLSTQLGSGVVIHQLLELAEALLQKVRHVIPRAPSHAIWEGWRGRGSASTLFAQGIEAMEWTIEDRGLAGLGDLQGVPWELSMEQFFESWVETVFESFAKARGFRVRSGRNKETITPIEWRPSFLGSQRYLMPDLILEKEGDTLIVDAKYKRHFEELSTTTWHNLEEQLRENHREDFLQILAYANLANSPNITCMLVYPCTLEHWMSLKRRGRIAHTGALRAHQKNLSITLFALPMWSNLDEILGEMQRYHSRFSIPRSASFGQKYSPMA